MKVIQNKKPTSYLHISNKFILNNKSNEDFIINIYYLSNNKIQLIIRKINNMYGWNFNLSINIFDLNNDKNELFYIGSSNKNYKKINIYSYNITFVEKDSKKLIIPKVIFQTNKSRTFQNDLSFNSILSFLEFNPSYEYKYFDDKESREFIKKNFNENYLYYYDIIYPGAFKADFFRYCYLYINGGFYFDNKSILLCSLDDIIEENDELILCQDNHKLGLYNAIMMCAPKNQLFFNLINKIIYKIKNFVKIFQPYTQFNNYKKLDNILSLTGPNLLYEEFNILNLDYYKHILMKHDILGNYQNYKNLVVKFKNNTILYKNYHNFNIHNPNHYSKLWIKHKVFYKNYFNNNEYIFLVKPNTYKNIELKFYFIDNSLLIIGNNKLIFDIEVDIIDKNSNKNNISISKINNTYHLIDYDYENNYEYVIKSINHESNDELNNLKFSINKILDKYYLVILNLQKSSINHVNVYIETNLKSFNYILDIQDIYKIDNISNLFNI